MPLPKRFAQKGKAKDKRILANRYSVDKRLGTGNFGTAWLVADRKSKEEKEKLKVVKEMAVGDLQPDETVDAMHEAKLLRNLDHPGIVKFHDSFIEGHFFCIVTEYCEGGDLDQKILEYKKKKKLIPEFQVVEWTIQLLLAVQYMHERKVLHRDLKARNIFLRNDKIKIGDFGISRILMGTTDLASTFVGTPYYMSPEVLKHEGYNSKSDVWSVGCILYELASLKHAFEGESLMGVMYKIVEGNLPEWPSGYSKELGGVCSSILIKDPVKRPSASEALKIPFIARQMELIKNTMMAQHQAKEHKDSINREAQMLANTMKHSPHLEEIRRESDRKKWKNMTPRERMRLRKQEQADKDAQRLKEAGMKQRLETHKKFQQIREYQNPYETSKVPIWSGRPDQRKPPPPVDPSAYATRDGASVWREEDEDDLSTDEDERDAHTYDERVGRPSVDKRRVFNTVGMDDRPITPMRNKMVYDPRNSSLDFKDGIPDKPEIAETYYSQFEDFEENGASSDDDDDDDDDDVIYSTTKAKNPQRSSISDDDEEDDAEGTLVAGAVADKEQEDLIHFMQTALDMSDTVKSTTLVADDSTAGAYGPAVRNMKIKRMRANAIKVVGQKQFDLAYSFLKKARFGDRGGRTMDEAEIFSGLSKFVTNTNDCFLIDQLLFLEEQERIAAET